jgi:hypothetical protein
MVIRGVAASATVVAVAVALVAPAKVNRGTPLWPGSHLTREGRDAAVRRALSFLSYFARTESNYKAYGSDLLSMFYNIAETSRDPQLSSAARAEGHRLSLNWRRIHPHVPHDAGAFQVADLVFGHDPAGRLGAPDERMGAELREAAARFTVFDYLLFDPEKEPPPSDIPKECEKCGHQNPRGSKVCERCNTKLEWRTRYDLYQDALIMTYTGDRAGITLGAPFVQVIKWLPVMRPYPPRQPKHNYEYYSGVYTATHVVYTSNDYSQYMLNPNCFAPEVEHLKATLRHAVTDHDAETMGEYLDSLRTFGIGFEDANIRKGFEFLLSIQNRDGSWGDVHDPDIYGRYHPTWTSVDGLRDYNWSKVAPCPFVK